MTITRTVVAAVIASFLITALPVMVSAEEETKAQASVDLRAAIDRAAAQSVAASNAVITSPATRTAARARQGGGGGGSSVMIWTLVGTVTSLAATYFIVKEMNKETEKLTAEAR